MSRGGVRVEDQLMTKTPFQVLAGPFLCLGPIVSAFTGSDKAWGAGRSHTRRFKPVALASRSYRTEDFLPASFKLAMDPSLPLFPANVTAASAISHVSVSAVAS